MSATKAEQPAQPAAEHVPAAPVIGGHNLDNLQSMLNLIFIQSGRFIKEHQSGGGTGRMKIALQRAVPVATERYHDALDELENEVRLAQVVLRRDVALLKQDRKKREVAAKEKEAEKARLVAESKNVPVVEKKPEPVVEKVSTPAQQEVPIEEKPAAQPEPEKPLERKEEDVPPPIDTSAAETAERDPLFDGTPTTANPQENEFDFDAMFGDAMDTTDGGGHDDMMGTTDNMDFNFDEGHSLLRGLEDFAKSGDDMNGQPEENVDIDISMPDLPDLNPPADLPAPAEPSATEQPAATKPPTPPATQAAPENTNTATTNDATNDAAGGDDAANNDDIMGGMMTDNLDDLFDIDDYENPEQSSFDDAFSFFE